ncbi:MAG: DUF2298 domain-containing protein [Methylococcales bacterium]|nr:DUF2298 domain-containing protein [Methylococcales bacterium]
MNLIYYFCTVALLLLNVAGLTRGMSRWLPHFALARASGILLLCVLCFFMEHSGGFGKLTWLWPFTTAAAITLLYTSRHQTNSANFWRAEGVFLLAFAYGFAWKWAFPMIYPTSERVTDLYFIGNYLPGETLPPLDHWFPPNRFNFYYALQHYAAALMGRVLGLGPGLTYNLAFSLIMALTITLVWDFISGLLKESWKRWLIMLTFMAGGTGATPFVHLSYAVDASANAQQMVGVTSDAMWASQRFIGGFDQRLNTAFGQSVFPPKATPTWEPRDLPLEDFGYQFFVGDYHPPLGGFLLLMLAIASIGAFEQQRRAAGIANVAEADSRQASLVGVTPQAQRFALQVVLAFTVPLMIATNTWAFPLQAALVMGWIVWRYVQGSPPAWKALILGGGVGFLLLYPFLTEFASQAVPTPIKWVQAQDHTPVIGFLALHWPLLLFGLLSVFSKGTRRLALLFSVVFLGLLLVSECIYVDDPTGGKYERTNTVMKWWGWIWSGGLVALATPLLASQVRWVKGLVVLALLLINVYVFDVARYWVYTDQSAAGKLAADSVYTQDPVTKNVFGFLAQAPDGIVLENNYGGSFTESGIYAAFAVKPSLLGWPMHLLTWHSGY